MARDRAPYSMSRRSFCRASLAVLITPGIAVAQGSTRVRRIGVLDSGAPDTPEEIWKQAEPLRQLGWVEGENLHVERRYGNARPEQLPPLAEELLRTQVEIIVSWGTSATLAAKRATTTVPIVFNVGDPVLVGLVANLARPGGNLTGFSQAGPEVTAKSLSVLKELLPGLQRIGLLWDVGSPYARATRGQFERTCQPLGLMPIVVDITVSSDISDALAQFMQRRVQALVLPGHDMIWQRRSEIVEAATKYRFPIMAYDDAMVREAGALISYHAAVVEWTRIRADYVDRILRGAKPADLPVRQPTKFELVINLKTAKALGLTIPQSLLLRADEVIQ